MSLPDRYAGDHPGYVAAKVEARRTALDMYRTLRRTGVDVDLARRIVGHRYRAAVAVAALHTMDGTL
jgi:hypothetical protein